MTDPVVLHGTQSNGETLPVQVNSFGQLVAEGLTGAEGPEGPEGPQGPAGPEGPPGPGIELPPDPYEGALLGWLNGGLAWVGAPPVPIPDGVFGPITGYDPSGYITVEGPIPDTVENGVYLFQCNQNGDPTCPSWNQVQDWASKTVIADLSSGEVADFYDGVLNNKVSAFGVPVVVNFTGTGFTYVQSVDVWMQQSANIRWKINDGPWQETTSTDGSFAWQRVAQGIGNLARVDVKDVRGGAGVDVGGVALDGKMLVTPGVSLQFRVNQVAGNSIIGSPSQNGLFAAGEYLRVPEQRVAPWVLYGNDPTSLIDHLRSK